MKIKIKIQEKSRMNLNFHPWPFEIVIHIWLTIMAVTTFAVVSALESCIVAFTVFFPALRFLTCAPPSRYDSWNPIKIVGMPVINQLFSVVNFLHVFFVVLACYANATWIASFSLSETFTVQFQAIDFCAFTALLVDWGPWGKVQLFNCFDDILIVLESAQIESWYLVKGQWRIFQEHIKEVLSGISIGRKLIKVRKVDELERTGTGRGMLGW